MERKLGTYEIAARAGALRLGANKRAQRSEIQSRFSRGSERALNFTLENFIIQRADELGLDMSPNGEKQQIARLGRLNYSSDDHRCFLFPTPATPVTLLPTLSRTQFKPDYLAKLKEVQDFIEQQRSALEIATQIQTGRSLVSLIQVILSDLNDISEVGVDLVIKVAETIAQKCFEDYLTKVDERLWTNTRQTVRAQVCSHDKIVKAEAGEALNSFDKQVPSTPLSNPARAILETNLTVDRNEKCANISYEIFKRCLEAKTEAEKEIHAFSEDKLAACGGLPFPDPLDESICSISCVDEKTLISMKSLLQNYKQTRAASKVKYDEITTECWRESGQLAALTFLVVGYFFKSILFACLPKGVRKFFALIFWLVSLACVILLLPPMFVKMLPLKSQTLIGDFQDLELKLLRNLVPILTEKIGPFLHQDL